MSVVIRLLSHTGYMGVAIVGSFLFFVAVSMLHSIFGPAKHEEQKSQGKRAIATELVKKPDPVEKAERRIRSIESSSATTRTGPSQSDVRFAPDLSIDAGPGDGAEVALQTQELSAEIFEEGETDEDAAPDYTPPVPYPDRAREMGAGGTLEAILVINHSGAVSSIDIVRTPGPLFSSEARRVFASWRFKPAKNKGVPVSVRKRQTIDFQLE